MVIYGLHPVLEALKARRVRALRVSPRDDRRLEALVDEARSQGVPVSQVPREVLDRQSRQGVHQGVVADVEATPAGSLEAFTAALDPPPLLVVLDGVEDPQNVGAILRTVDAAGATGVVRQTRRAALARRGGGQGVGRRGASRAGRRRREHRARGRRAQGGGRLDRGAGRRRRVALL